AADGIWIGERLDSRYLRAVERRLLDHADEGLDGGSTFGTATLLTGELPPLELPPQEVPPPRVTPSGSLIMPSDPLIETLQHLRSGNKERVLAALAGAARFDTIHVVQTIRLLAWN